MTYPPEPWDLHGHAYIGVWLMRGTDDREVPAGMRAIRILGLRVVAAAFFVYEEPSPLTYHELMATQVVRDGLRPRVNITDIWVDSPDSRDGGRELWAIPKELADFEVTTDSTYVATAIGSMRVGRRRRLPGRWPLGFRIAQIRGGAGVVSPVRGTGRLALVQARWAFAPDGRLGFLSGRDPLLTIAIAPFHLMFGNTRRGRR